LEFHQSKLKKLMSCADNFIAKRTSFLDMAVKDVLEIEVAVYFQGV